MSDASDAELIGGSEADPELFAEVFERHYESVRRYAQRRLGRDAGEEVAARTFESAFRARATFDLAFRSARPWLLGIATNLIRNHLRDEDVRSRATARLGRREERWSDGEIDLAERRAESSRIAADVASAVATLDPRDRDALLLFAWEDLSYEEIAAALGIPIGTVRSRLHRARTRLRELLGDALSIHGWSGDG